MGLMMVTERPLTVAMFVFAVLLAGCSGSNTDSSLGNDGSTTAPLVIDEDNTPLEDEGNVDDTLPAVAEPANPTVVADPLVPNFTQVTFDITVPAYQSDALQVAVEWGDIRLNAGWVGDEYWSVTNDFPTSTENTLTITFSDDNGAMPLGTYETQLETGTSAAETFTVTPDQFDTERWDTDNDGVSNLSELIAGTDALGEPEPLRILLFHETRGYRHDSIGTALLALEELAAGVNLETDQASDSAGVFTTENLSNYEAVVWVLTSGDVLNASEQSAFEAFIRSGGGYAGIHAASDTEYEWPWYGGLVGAYFERHPEIQSATQVVEDNTHPSTEHLGATWSRTDEWYDYNENPRARVNVLLTLDESSYFGGGMGQDHPSAWYHDYDGGRSWYTGGGHTSTSYAEADFRAHLLGGLTYAVGLEN